MLVCVIHRVYACVHVPEYIGMCLLQHGSDSWQQVCVLLCGGSRVRLTRGVKGGRRRRWGRVIAEHSPLGSPDTSPLRQRVQYVCVCVLVGRWMCVCLRETEKAGAHTYTSVCL